MPTGAFSTVLYATWLGRALLVENGRNSPVRALRCGYFAKLAMAYTRFENSFALRQRDPPIRSYLVAVSSLRFTNVGPFEDVGFEFDPHVNVFTGPNNVGKSSVLWVLGEILVYPFVFPTKLLRPGKSSTFQIDVSGESPKTIDGALPIGAPAVGVAAQDDRTGNEEERETVDVWTEHIANLERIGFSKFIPALRHSTDFRSTGPTTTPHEDDPRVRTINITIPEIPGRRSSSVRQPVSPLMAHGLVNHPELFRRSSLVSDDATLVSDQAVIQKMIDLDYRGHVKGELRYRNIIDEIGRIAAIITDGFVSEFSGFDEDRRGFYAKFDTADGTMPLNTLSQGTQSIIQWLAHLLIGYAEYYDYPQQLKDQPGILIVDEIDLHLHPSWQTRVIPTLVDNYPNLQIFCSTHSPLMLAGLNEGQVQLLRRGQSGEVTVSTNDVDIVGWSADEILRNFLGVPDPTDFATAQHLVQLKELRSKAELSESEVRQLEELRHTVSQDLLRGPASPEMDRITGLIRLDLADSDLP